MKKILLLVGFALALLPNIYSQNYFVNEDFNNGIPSTWTNTAISGSHDWMHGIMSDETDNIPNASLDGTPMVYFNDDSLGYIDNGATNNNNTVELLSPVVNSVANYPLYLEFDYNFRRYNAGNYFKVEIHDGTSWTTLLNVSNNDCGKWGGVCTPPHFSQDISSYAGNTLQLRFSYHDGNDWAYWAAFDNVKLYSPFDFDVMPISINTPFSNCGLTSSETVSVTIQNKGLQTISNFPISYQIDNNTPITETVTQSIQRDSTHTFIFSTPANLSVIRNYNVKVYTSLASDQAPGNDVLEDSIGNVASIAPDYSENFDNGAPGWKIYGTNPSFEIGQPNSNFITAAVSAPNALVTNLDGHYNSNELSYVETPCFDFTATKGAPFMRFDLKFQSQSNDELWMEQSFDGGATWTKVVPFINSKNWYNNKQKNVWQGNSGQWIKVENALSNINGQNNVKYRFVFKSNAVDVLEGFAIDNFSIKNPDPYDVKIFELNSPDNNATCGFNKTQELIVTIFNQGQNPIPMGSLKYRIKSGPGSGQTIYDDTKALNILPDDPNLWVHAIPIDLETSGTYVLDIWIEIPNDTVNHNDSIIGFTINHNAVRQSFVDFESGAPWTLDQPANGQGWTTWTKTPYQWQIQSQNTTAQNTGPAADHTTNFPIGYGKYMYTYVKPDPMGTPFGDTTTFTSPCINFGMGNGGVINYWYHKYGGNMGNLFVDLYDPVTKSWVILQTIPGPTHNSKLENWIEETVRINTTYSSRVRFRAVSRGNPLGHMAIDDIEVHPPDSIDGKLKKAFARGTKPEEGCNLKTNENITILVQNFGLVEIDTLPICYTLYDENMVPSQSSCDTAFNVGILPGANFVYILPQTFDFSGYDTSFYVKIWLQVPGDTTHKNDTFNLKITNETQRFEYLETFEQDNNTSGGYFNSLFVAVPPDEDLYSWRPRTGQTPTFNTGPNTDHTPTGPGKYMYVEANGKESVASLVSPCIDLTGTQAANLEYWYHMFGADLQNDSVADKRDTLFIDVHDGSQWNMDVFRKYNQQQFSSSQPWKRQRVTLSQFTGNFVKVRFRSFRNSEDALGDIAIDDVAVNMPDYQEVAVDHDHIVHPRTGRCNYFSNEKLKVHVRNVGRDNLDSIVLGFEVRDINNILLFSGSETFKYPFGFGLPPGSVDTLTFVTRMDLSAYGTYKIRVFNLQPGDDDPQDDETQSIVVHPQPQAIPVVENFESLPLNQNINFSNGWKGQNIGYRWVIKRGQDVLTSTFNLTGPGEDATNGNSMSKFLLAKQLGPLPTQVGTPTRVTTPCVAIPDVPNPSIEYYFHKFGNQMGNLILEIHDDTNWVEIARNIGETHTGHFKDWTRERVDLAPFKHKNAKFRWTAYYGTQVNGSGNSEMGLDNIWIGALPEWDIKVDSIVSPNSSPFQCFSSTSTVRVRLENVGVENLDFTQDTLTIRAIVKVNGVSRNSQDTIIMVIDNNTQNPNGLPFQSDSSMVVDLYPVDLSEYGQPHEIIVETFMTRDSIIVDNNIFTTLITPNISMGTLDVDPDDICLGTSSVLSTTGFQGEIEWQYWREIGTNGVWQRVVGGINGRPQMSVVPSDTTMYRLKICNASNSDSILYSSEAPFNQVLTVNVIDPVPPVAVHDTVCGSGTMELKAIADANVDAVRWYDVEEDGSFFHQGFSFTDHFTETDTFYLESIISGCFSRTRTPVYAKVAPYPVIDLGPDTAICPDSVYYLNAGGGANYIYRWTRDGDPSHHDSLDNQVQTIGVFPYYIWQADSSNANYITINYSVYVESPFTCASSGSVEITILNKDTGICTVGIDDEFVNNQLQIYPNPSSGVFTVYLDRDEASNASLELYSIDGKAIFEEKIETKEYSKRFDLSKYPDGVYFIKLVSDEATVTKKVILTN